LCRPSYPPVLLLLPLTCLPVCLSAYVPIFRQLWGPGSRQNAPSSCYLVPGTGGESCEGLTSKMFTQLGNSRKGLSKNLLLVVVPFIYA
jgi:hypothetical protein